MVVFSRNMDARRWINVDPNRPADGSTVVNVEDIVPLDHDAECRLRRYPDADILVPLPVPAPVYPIPQQKDAVSLHHRDSALTNRLITS